MPLTDAQLLRYSRQILLPQIGIAGQQRLLDSSILVVGLGGLGSPAAAYLAAAGVGRLIIADGDQVELSNLQRQILFRSSDLNRPKAEVAKEQLAALNPEIEITAINDRLEGDQLGAQISSCDLAIDASDNFATRFAINEYSVAMKRPLVSGAAIRASGQITVFRPDLGDSPCYRCLYSPEGSDSEDSCSETGVFTPLVGIIGCMQAAEAMKITLGIATDLSGRLLQLDLITMQWRESTVRRDPACPVCGGD